VFANYPKKGIIFIVGFGVVLNTPPGFNRHVMEPKRFLIYPKRGIAHALNNFGHKQYPLIAWTKII
jgi:hypothetical protein